MYLSRKALFHVLFRRCLVFWYRKPAVKTLRSLPQFIVAEKFQVVVVAVIAYVLYSMFQVVQMGISCKSMAVSS